MKKIIATLSVVMMMASCGNTEKAELEKLQASYTELETKYNAMVAEKEQLVVKCEQLEQQINNTPEAPANNCCGEAAMLRQKLANAKKAVRKLKDDFNDYQSGFGLTNNIDIDNRIKAVERSL